MTNDKLVKITRIKDGYVLRLDPESIVEIASVNDVTEVTYLETPEETVTVEVYEDIFKICHKIAEASDQYGGIERENFGRGYVRLPLRCETYDRDIDLPAYLVNCVRYEVEEKIVFITVHSLQGAYLTMYSINQDFDKVCARIAYALGFKA